jgi:hypothetical protein
LIKEVAPQKMGDFKLLLQKLEEQLPKACEDLKQVQQRLQKVEETFHVAEEQMKGHFKPLDCAIAERRAQLRDQLGAAKHPRTKQLQAQLDGLEALVLFMEKAIQQLKKILDKGAVVEALRIQKLVQQALSQAEEQHHPVCDADCGFFCDDNSVIVQAIKNMGRVSSHEEECQRMEAMQKEKEKQEEQLREHLIRKEEKRQEKERREKQRQLELERLQKELKDKEKQHQREVERLQKEMKEKEKQHQREVEAKEKEENRLNDVELNKERTCWRCGQSFTIATNNDRACRYHSDVRFLFLIFPFNVLTR